jgi:hypothetical protein
MKYILTSSNDTCPPFQHLVPIIEALIEGGNEPVSSDWFCLDQDGWCCLLKNPIDFDLLESKFEFPSSISLSRKDNSILDTQTWIEIKGGVNDGLHNSHRNG